MLAVDPSAVDALAVLTRSAEAATLLETGDDRAAAYLCAETLAMFRGDVLAGAGDGEWVIRTVFVSTPPGCSSSRSGSPRGFGSRTAAKSSVNWKPPSSRSVPGEPVGSPDHGAVPSRTPGRRPVRVPARSPALGRRPRTRPGPGTAAAGATDPDARCIARHDQPPYDAHRRSEGKPAVDDARADRSRFRARPGGGSTRDLLGWS